MKKTFGLLLMALLLLGCASGKKVQELNYCTWSLDNSRWAAHRPDWSNAFIASLFSQSDTALQHITGGQIKRENVFDNEGHVIQVTSNNLGIQTVEDLTSQCYLTPIAFEERKVGVFSYQDLVLMKVIK